MILRGKRIVVHFGAHKTASTALQVHLAGAAESLGDSAYFGPSTLRVPQQPLRTLVRFGRVASPRRRALLTREIIEALGQVQARDVLISDEMILGPMLGLTRALYPDTRNLTQLLLALRLMGAEVHGVLFIREQTSLLQSAYTYRTSRGALLTPEQFSRRIHLDRLSWLSVLHPLVLALGRRLHVIPYRALRTDIEGVEDHLSNVHPAFVGMSDLPRVNVTARPFALYLTQQLCLQGALDRPAHVGRVALTLQRILDRGEGPRDSLEALVASLPTIKSRLKRRGLVCGPAACEAALTQAATHFHQALAAGRHPLSLPESIRQAIRQRYAEDNQLVLGAYVHPRWQDCWS